MKREKTDGKDGMIEDIYNGLTQIGVDPVGMKEMRMDLVDFIMPLYTFK